MVIKHNMLRDTCILFSERARQNDIGGTLQHVSTLLEAEQLDWQRALPKRAYATLSMSQCLHLRITRQDSSVNMKSRVSKFLIYVGADFSEWRRQMWLGLPAFSQANKGQSFIWAPLTHLLWKKKNVIVTVEWFIPPFFSASNSAVDAEKSSLM